MKILRTIKLKKKHLSDSYNNIIAIIGYEQMDNCRCIPYQYLIYFLDIYPMESRIKKKILFQASFYTIYWDQKDPCVPKDRLLFIFDSCQIQKNKNTTENYLYRYLKSHCENNLSGLYHRIRNNPNHAI